MTPALSLWQRLLLRLLLGGSLPSSWAKRVQRAIAGDAAWSAAYDDARRAERAGHRAFSAGQIDLVEALVLDAVAADEAAVVGPTWWQQLAPLTAACALIGVFFVVGDRDAESPGGKELTARGSEDGARFGVRVRCLDAAHGRIVDEAEAGPRARPSSSSDALRCPRGSLLSFGLTNLDAADVYVYAVGVAGDGALRFFAPFDEPASSMKIEAGTVDRVLDVAADTGAFPDDAGVFTLFTLFSERPLRGPDVARTLRDLQQRTGHVQALDRLPLDALTTRIDLQL